MTDSNKYNKWVDKDRIEKPPVRCRVDMRDGCNPDEPRRKA